MRDRLGMICGVCAVACLASFIVHWSRDYPIQRSSWEQDLFGDLADVEPVESEMPPADVEPPTLRVRQPAPQPEVLSVAEPTDVVTSSEAVKAPRLTTPSESGVLPPTPINERPVHQRPRFVLPVAHNEPARAASVWLSGEIEMPPNDPHNATRQPVTLFFAPQESQ